MALTAQPFANIVTFTRDSGATRVNAAGLIVGVDFSSTSNTIGTGSRTFTLAADANVNRDWVVGSRVRAVSQAGAVGTMDGTVTSYTPSTQALVINVTSITGSGTSTNWRIGSLEFRRDFDPVTLQPRGGLVEGGATNNLARSNDFGTAPWRNGTVVANQGVSPDGSNNAWLLSAANREYDINAQRDYLSIFVKFVDAQYCILSAGGNNATNSAYIYDLVNKTPLVAAGAVPGKNPSVQDVGNGWLRISFYAGVINQRFNVAFSQSSTVTIQNGPFTGSGLIYGAQESSVQTSSYIPTTTISVTRAADLPNVDGSRFSQFYNSAQGTLVYEMTPIASAVSAVAGSLNDGTTNNAIRVQQKQSGTLGSIRKMATDGQTDVMAINAVTGNTLRANGVDYTEISDQSGVVKFGVASSGLGKFLNVGGTENFRESTDSGLTYNARTIGGTFAGAHFAQSRFIIAGSTATINGATVGSVIVSPDGLSFRRVNIPGLTQQLQEITSNGTNQYVAGGDGGVIYTSPDGETWTAQTSGIPTANSVQGIHFFNGRYVAAVNAANQSRYSDNGTTWTLVTGLAAGMVDVSHNGTNLWVAVGLGGAIYTSADGITWTSRTSNTAQILRGIFFADGLWVAVGSAGTVVTSPDGITWTDHTATSGTTQQINEVFFFGGNFYYAANGQVISQNTATGIVAGTTWASINAAVSGNLNGIATNGTRLLICGSSGAITTSEDGTTFTSRTGNSTALNGAAFGNGTYVVVGNAVNGSGLIATVDPLTFAYRRRVSGQSANLNKVIFTRNAFSAISSGGAGGRFFTSADNGATWTSFSVGGNGYQGLADSGTLYVATSSDGVISRSANGQTWTLSASGQGGLQDIEFANGLFVTVGNAGVIRTSTDGITFTQRTSGTTQNLFAVMYSQRDQMWYAAGDGGTILRAADPTGTWENIANDAVGAVINGGTVQANPFLPNLIVNATNKVAMRLQANNFAVSVNGADAIIDTSVSLPSVNRLSIGMNGVNGQQFNGWIRKITYFPTIKTDAELKGLST